MNSYQDEQKVITSHFLKSYLTAFYVDLNRQDALVIRNAFHPEQEGTHISDCFKVLYERVAEGVFPGNLDVFEKMLSPEHIREQLKHNTVLKHTFQDTRLESPKFIMMEIVSGSDEDHAVFSFKDVTEESLKEQARQQELIDALEKAKEEAIRTDYVLAFSGASRWSYEISSNDEVLAVNYADRLERGVYGNVNESPMAWLDRVHPDERQRVYENFMAAIYDHSGQTPYDSTFRIINKDGKYVWGKSIGRLLRRADGTAELFGMSMNISQQIEEQEQQKKQLADALEMAQAANQAKTAFLNSMSHDIRTPMNAILGYTSMAMKNVGNPEKSLEYLSKINTAGNTLLELVNQVLDMSRIESGKVVLKEEPADVIEKTYDMAELIGHTAHAKHIKVSTNINPVTNRKIYADGGRMNQLILNILGNAVKYTPEGGSITYSVDQIPCDRPGYATYVFTTEDNGIGMSKEYMEHVFEPFSRESTSTVSKIQGSGLGMAIVRKIVDMMGGKIDIESEPGKGTKIAVTITFRIAAEEKKADAETKTANTDDVLKGKHALLVEDNEMNSEIASMILQEHGISVETADDGDIAVQIVEDLVERGELNRYDFILMDVQMPRMNGYEATARIREILAPTNVHIPIIALSANAFEEDRQRSLEAGMDEHIAKPIDVGLLCQTLARFV